MVAKNKSPETPETPEDNTPETPEDNTPETPETPEGEEVSLFGLLTAPEVEVTVTSRMIEVTDDHRAAADGAIRLYKKDPSAWLKLGPVPNKPMRLPNGEVKTLSNKELDTYFEEFLAGVKVAGNQAGYIIRKGTTPIARVLRYHVTGPVTAKNSGSKDETTSETPETGSSE